MYICQLQLFTRVYEVGITKPNGIGNLWQKNLHVSLKNCCRSLSQRPCCTIKKLHWCFSHFCSNEFGDFWVHCCGITGKWVHFPSIDVYLYQFAQIIQTYIIDLLSGAQSKKVSLSLVFCAAKHLLFSVHRNQQFNLAFRMTGVEDTHLTRAVIPFQVGENNFLFLYCLLFLLCISLPI